jgi:hypothetical protein
MKTVLAVLVALVGSLVVNQRIQLRHLGVELAGVRAAVSEAQRETETLRARAGTLTLPRVGRDDPLPIANDLKQTFLMASALRQRMQSDAAHRLPELRYAYDSDWFMAISMNPLPPVQEAMLESLVKNHVLNLLQIGVSRYEEATHGRPPDSIEAIAGYVPDPQFDPSILGRYQLRPDGKVAAR